MRYKVRVPDDDAFQAIEKLLREQAELFVSSPRRRMFSTGELPDGVRESIRARGGEVIEDRGYDPE